ncbi:MAG: ABC transporter substrate-binding protein [Firmicutes bacterium]|jgi:putative ABC transport system substrate-binding protein|nr:ABC transporter substrate-binding protein [Bacillota bacterium]
MRRWAIGAAMMVLLLAALLGASSVLAAEGKIKIGITQIVEHPALDAARQGFIDELAEAGYDESRVVYDMQNAQGDFATAQTIAEKFVSSSVDLILAIATPTAQATANVTQDIPILITAVTDPVVAGLVESIDAPGTNVTGTSDLTPVAKQLELLRTIRPQAKRVGVMYNPGEANSLVQLDLAREAAAELGLTLVEVPVDNSSSVYQAAQSAVGRVDAIYVPTDNTVVSALESVIIVAENAKLPLVAGETDSVRRGAMATISIDYYGLGRQTGRMALEILENNADPASMPIEYLEDVALVLNPGAAQRMGVELSADLLAEASEIVD